MKLLTLLGISLTAVLGGNFPESGQLDSLLQLQLVATAIILGGTCWAVLVQRQS